MTTREIITVKEKLQKELAYGVYGAIPARPTHLTGKFISEDKHFAAGKAIFRRIDLICDFEGKIKELPLSVIMPVGKDIQKFIVYLSDDFNVPSKYLPIEEIIDRGYAIVNLDHSVIAKCDGDFKNGICSNIKVSRKRKDAPGKIALWAWGVMRVIDYLSDLEYVDKDRIAVAGHSIPGKAVLLAGAFDDRIKMIIANDSVNMGSVKSKTQIAEEYPYLFCPRYAELAESGELPCDHEMLIRLCADRKILVGAAEDDSRSDPKSELEHIEKMIAVGYTEDNFHFHSRPGSHYLSRDDWKIYLDYFDSF